MRINDTNRGVHPKVRAGTVGSWLYETGATVLNRVSNGGTVGSGSLNASLGATSPTLIDGVCTKAHSYDGSTQARYSAAVPSSHVTAATGSWYVGAWVRFTADPTGTDTVFGLGGRVGDFGSDDDNELCLLRVTSTLAPQMFWEHTNGTVDVLSTASSFVFEKHKWYLWAYRKYPTVAGTPGNFDLDLLINGRVVEQFTDLVNADSGATTNQRWKSGAAFDSVSSPVDYSSVDISSAFFASGTVTDEEVESDFRRGIQLETGNQIRVRVSVEDDTGTLQDLTDLEGEDFVESVQITDTVDNPTESLTVNLSREIGDLSLNPLRADSKLNHPDPLIIGTTEPLLKSYREILVEVARFPLFLDDPLSGDWWEKFRGNIDKIDWSKDPIPVNARDRGGRYQDIFIEEARTYPKSLVRDPVEDAAQDLVDDWAGETISLIEDVGPGTSRRITFTRRTRFRVGDQCKIIGTTNFNGTDLTVSAVNSATQIEVTPGVGGTPANEATGTVAFEVQGAPDPGWDMDAQVLPESHLLAQLRQLLGQIAIDCRFKWSGEHGVSLPTIFTPRRDAIAPDIVIDKNDVIRLGKGESGLEDVRNAIEVVYPNSNDLNSEGQKLPGTVTSVDAASVADFDRRYMKIIEDQSSQLDTSTEATTYANGVLSDLAQEIARVQHQIKPIPELEISDLGYFRADSLNYTAAQAFGIRQLQHNLNLQNSNTSIQAQGKPSVGHDRWLQLEAGRYGKAPISDPTKALDQRGFGSLGPIQRNLAEQTLNARGGQYVELPNHDFSQSYNGDNNPPAHWRVTTGTWGTDVTIEKTTQQSSEQAIRLVDTGSDHTLRSDLIQVISDGVPYTGLMTYQRINAGDGPLTIRMRWYDRDRAFVSVSPSYNPAVFAGAGVFETQRIGNFVPAASARFGELEIIRSGAQLDDYIIDKVQMYRTAREVLATLTSNQTGVTTGVWTQVELDDDSSGFSTGAGPRDYGSQFDPTATNWDFTAQESGLYDIVGQVTGFAQGAAPAPTLTGANVKIQKNGADFIIGSGSTFVQAPVFANRLESVAQASSPQGATYLVAGDVITLHGYLIGATGNLGIGFVSGEDNTFLSVKQRTGD